MSAGTGYVETGWREWDAVAYLLAAPMLGTKFTRYMDPVRSTIDFDAIEAKAFSHAEALLVALARNFWSSGSPSPSIKELVATLDDANFARVMTGIGILRGHPRNDGLRPAIREASALRQRYARGGS